MKYQYARFLTYSNHYTTSSDEPDLIFHLIMPNKAYRIEFNSDSSSAFNEAYRDLLESIDPDIVFPKKDYNFLGLLNHMGSLGWRVINLTPDNHVIFERAINNAA